MNQVVHLPTDFDFVLLGPHLVNERFDGFHVEIDDMVGLLASFLSVLFMFVFFVIRGFCGASGFFRAGRDEAVHFYKK